MARRAWCARVRSVLTSMVTLIEAETSTAARLGEGNEAVNCRIKAEFYAAVPDDRRAAAPVRLLLSECSRSFMMSTRNRRKTRVSGFW